MKRYALHSGWVRSRNDGDRHWIGAARLARLYGVRLDECFDASHYRGLPVGLIHLHPQSSGDYALPTA